MVDVDLNENGELILRDGDAAVPVRAARSFPWTAPDRFIVLRDADDQDDPKERATVDDLAALPAKSRGAIEAWLQRHTFIPKVQRVIEVKPGNAALLFHLDTDRGEHKIKVREREDLRSLADGRTLIKDTDGVVFEVPPWEELDEKSQDQLRLVL